MLPGFDRENNNFFFWGAIIMYEYYFIILFGGREESNVYFSCMNIKVLGHRLGFSCFYHSSYTYAAGRVFEL